ncbi:hypothetical protein ADUPG1_009655, partial [Aduncisulcus paluster]
MSVVDDIKTIVPKTICQQPISFLGIQNDTPICWSRDGQYLTLVSDSRSIYICKLVEKKETGTTTVEVLDQLRGCKSHVNCLEFSPNDQFLIAGEDDGFCIFNMAQKKVIYRVMTEKHESAHDSAVKCALWIFEGRILLTGSKDTTIKAWDTTGLAAERPKLEFVETLSQHKGPVLILSATFPSFSRSPEVSMTIPTTSTNSPFLLASAGRDSTVQIWNITTLTPPYLEKRKDDKSICVKAVKGIEGHRGDIISLSWRPDSIHLYTGARDNCVNCFNVTSGVRIKTNTDHFGDVTSIVACGPNRILTSSADGSVKLYTITSPDDPQPGIIAPLPKDEEPEEEQEVTSLAAESDFLTDLLKDAGASEATPALLPQSVPHDALVFSFNPINGDEVARMRLNPRLPFLATA